MGAIADLTALGADKVIGFALPPRCAGCGTIVDQLHSFCIDCWASIDWLGNSGCMTCGMPLEGTEAETCGRCLAETPIIARTRAAVAYGDLTRILPLRLKYSRKVALAKTMARFMAPLIPAGGEDRVLVPVPLHRGRLWARGFNQSVLLARELSRQSQLSMLSDQLVRARRTVPLKGLNLRQRKREVAGAFEVPRRERIDGKTTILVDDVLTTGSTAEACAKALRRAGAARVELICWARVVRPAQLMR